MSTKEGKPYPDKWHVITYQNKHRSGTSKEAVKDSQARYYVLEKYSNHSIASSGNRYDFNEFEVFDANFKPTQLKENGVLLKDFTTEIWDRQGVGTSKVGFTIQDKVGVEKKEWVSSYGISGFMHCIKLMQQLSNYYSWDEYNLAIKLSEQNIQLLKLSAEILKLKLYKKEVEEVKSNVEKLYKRLYESEIEARIKHLLSTATITDKDIAIAFGTTQKRVRAIRKSLNS